VFQTRHCDSSVRLFYGPVVQVSWNLLIDLSNIISRIIFSYFSKFYDVSRVHCSHYGTTIHTTSVLLT